MQNRFLAHYIAPLKWFYAILSKSDSLAVKKDGYTVLDFGFSLLSPMVWGRGYLPHTPTSNYFSGPTRSKKHPLPNYFTTPTPTPVFIGHPDL